jgi:hypothetical protein
MRRIIYLLFTNRRTNETGLAVTCDFDRFTQFDIPLGAYHELKNKFRLARSTTAPKPSPAAPAIVISGKNRILNLNYLTRQDEVAT